MKKKLVLSLLSLGLVACFRPVEEIKPQVIAPPPTAAGGAAIHVERWTSIEGPKIDLEQRRKAIEQAIAADPTLKDYALDIKLSMMGAEIGGFVGSKEEIEKITQIVKNHGFGSVTTSYSVITK